MDRYQRVEKPKPESPINENEIRITTQGAIRNYISYATTLLQVPFIFSSPHPPFSLFYGVGFLVILCGFRSVFVLFCWMNYIVIFLFIFWGFVLC